MVDTTQSCSLDDKKKDMPRQNDSRQKDQNMNHQGQKGGQSVRNQADNNLNEFDIEIDEFEEIGVE